MTKDEALKLALAYIEEVDYGPYDAAPVITGIKQALAQPAPVQEPVYLVEDDFGLFRITNKGDYTYWSSTGRHKTFIANATPPAQPPCPTCEALARTVMLDQTSHDQFKPDWDAMAVMVEEQQRMAKRIEDLEAMLERQTARIVDLQTHIENFDGEDR